MGVRMAVYAQSQRRTVEPLDAIRSLLWSRAQLQAEVLALRHELLVLKRQCAGRRVHFQTSDRVLWSWLSRLWPGWRQGLLLVRSGTVVRWNRQGFRLYWRWKSRSRCSGRPRIEPEVRDLIIEMHCANPTWGAPRIHGELLKLGFRLAQSTVSKYVPRHRKPPFQSWRTFLRNHFGKRSPSTSPWCLRFASGCSTYSSCWASSDAGFSTST